MIVMVLPTLRAVREAFAEWLPLAGGCESRLDSNAFGRVRKMTRAPAEAYGKLGTTMAWKWPGSRRIMRDIGIGVGVA